MSDLFATGATAVVGVIGVLSTYFTAKQGRDQTLALVQLGTTNARADARLAFFSELVAAARSVQRASADWTVRRTIASERHFDELLNVYSLLAATARLTESADVYESIIAFEKAYRHHRRSESPVLQAAAAQFKLEPLLETLRKALGQ